MKSVYREYLSNYTTMNVATASPGGGVDNATVYFAFDSDDILYFASDKDTLKVGNLARDGRVAITMNDGGATPTGVQLRGRAYLVTHAADRQRARTLLIARVPTIADFLEQPNKRFYRVETEELFLINFAWGIDWRRSVIG